MAFPSFGTGRQFVLALLLLCCGTPAALRSKNTPTRAENAPGGQRGEPPRGAAGSRHQLKGAEDPSRPVWPGNRMSGGRVQLHRALSKLGLCSRSVARNVIKAGRVSVNGNSVSNAFTWVDLKLDKIAVDDDVKHKTACR
eukprot:2516453-Rhodomonas_salina.1